MKKLRRHNVSIHLKFKEDQISDNKVISKKIKFKIKANLM